MALAQVRRHPGALWGPVTVLLLLALVVALWFFWDRYTTEGALLEARRAEALAARTRLETRIAYLRTLIAKEPCVAKANWKLE